MARPKGDRTERFNMLLSPAERLALDSKAAAAGLDASSYIRALIERGVLPQEPSTLRRARRHPYKTKASHEKAMRSRYLDQIREFTQAVIEAKAMWEADPLASKIGDATFADRPAVKHVVAAASRAACIGVYSPGAWTTVLRRLHDPGARKRVAPSKGQISIADVVLGLIDFENRLIDRKTVKEEIARIVTNLRRRTKA